MHLPEKAELLRVFVGDSDRYHHKPLYEAIVEAAREQHLAGATVLQGYLGYGARSRPAHRGRARRRAAQDRGLRRPCRGVADHSPACESSVRTPYLRWTTSRARGMPPRLGSS